MVSGGLPPLSVDPAQLSAAGGALKSSALELPQAPAPFMPVGTDPLSTAIIGQIPAVETPIATQLPLIKAEATTTASNVEDAAEAYATTDQQNGAAIDEVMQKRPPQMPTGSSGGSVPGGGGTDAMSQMMGMPMQMAQMPMQMMSGMASAPQGLMQGAQQAGQQVQQMAGQFGQGGTGPNAGAAPQMPAPELSMPESASEGAQAGEPDAERAPSREETSEEKEPQAPGRHRAAEADERINL